MIWSSIQVQSWFLVWIKGKESRDRNFFVFDGLIGDQNEGIGLGVWQIYDDIFLYINYLFKKVSGQKEKK